MIVIYQIKELVTCYTVYRSKAFGEGIESRQEVIHSSTSTLSLQFPFRIFQIPNCISVFEDSMVLIKQAAAIAQVHDCQNKRACHRNNIDTALTRYMQNYKELSDQINSSTFHANPYVYRDSNIVIGLLPVLINSALQPAGTMKF
jgi:hypothetical protein